MILKTNVFSVCVINAPQKVTAHNFVSNVLLLSEALIIVLALFAEVAIWQTCSLLLIVWQFLQILLLQLVYNWVDHRAALIFTHCLLEKNFMSVISRFFMEKRGIVFFGLICRNHFNRIIMPLIIVIFFWLSDYLYRIYEMLLN